MRLELIRGCFVTSSEGDMSYTMKRKRINHDKKSEKYGEEYETNIGKYPSSIESALNIIYDIEKFNSKVGDGKSKKSPNELFVKK